MPLNLLQDACVAESEDETRTFLDLAIHYVQKAQGIHFRLLYGDAQSGVTAAASFGVKMNTILEHVGCVDDSPADCHTFDHGLFLNGANAVFLKYASQVHNFSNIIQQTKRYPVSENQKSWFLQHPTFQYLLDLGLNYQSRALEELTQQYLIQIELKTGDLNSYQTALVIVYVILVVSYTIRVVNPLMRRFSKDVENLRAIHGIIPIEILLEGLQLQEVKYCNPVHSSNAFMDVEDVSKPH
jgi:hypothetical protein